MLSHQNKLLLAVAFQTLPFLGNTEIHAGVRKCINIETRSG